MRLLVVLGLLATSTATADTKVLRFSQSTPLPPKWQQLPERISTSLAAVIDGQPSDESLITLRCDGGERCLDDIASRLGANELVFGTIRSGGDRETKLVVITRYVPGRERSEEEFTIALTDDAAPRALALQAQAFLQKPLPREPAPVIEDDPDERRDDERRDDERERDGDGDVVATAPRSRISPTTYAILVGGGIGVAVGIGFTLQSANLRGQLANAPDSTTADLRNIRQLEQRGQAYTNAGIAFSVAGAAILGFGIYRAWREKRNDTAALAIAPARNGATLVFARSW